MGNFHHHKKGGRKKMKVKQEKYQSSILAFDNTLSPEILFYVWILLKSRRVDTSIQIT